MASYNELNALIDAYINRNGVQAITGQILNGVLKAMVEQLGRGYTIMGAAIPTTDPGTPDGPECYFASETGTYTDFDGLQVAPGELALLCYTPSDGWTKATIYEGFQEVEATIDGNVGTPSVGVSYADGVLSFDFHNMKGNPGQNGQDGQDGAAAGFGTISADIAGGVGTPAVSVESSGPATAKNLQFHFTNLKGETGVTSVVATVDNTTGTPACTVSLVGQQLTLAFSGLKGAQGDTGSSVDYPFTIVNNLTTDDATQALSAAQGVVLAGQVSQLEAKVDGIIASYDSNTLAPSVNGKYIYSSGLAFDDAGWAISGLITLLKGQTLIANATTTRVGTSVIAEKNTGSGNPYYAQSSGKAIGYETGVTTYSYTAMEDCSVVVCYKISTGFSAIIKTKALDEQVEDAVEQVNELSETVEQIQETQSTVLRVTEKTLVSKTDNYLVSYYSRNGIIVGYDTTFQKETFLKKVSFAMYNPAVGSDVIFYLGTIDQRGWLLPRLTFTAKVTEIDVVGTLRVSVVDLEEEKILARGGEVLFMSPQKTGEQDSTVAWGINSVIPGVKCFYTYDILDALTEQVSKAMLYIDIIGKEVDTIFALKPEVEKALELCQDNYEEIERSKIYYDKITGDAYRIVVVNGVLTAKSTHYNSVLILGNSYCKYGDFGFWQCDDQRGMAASVYDNDYPAFLKGIIGSQSMDKKNVADWERNLVNYDYEDNWGLSNIYDAIVFFVGANIVNSSGVYQGYSEAIQYLLNTCPNADIFIVSASSGAIFNNTQSAANDKHIPFIDIRGISGYNIKFVSGDYYFGKNNQYYAITDGGVLGHPNDYGHWIIATLISLGMGTENYVDKSHDITIHTSSGGSAMTSMEKGLENGVVTIHCTPEQGKQVASLSVVDSDNNTITTLEQVENVFTFIMPSSNVNVSVTFAD